MAEKKGSTRMIDPYNITNYNQTEEQLQEVLLFWICVAGKTAVVIARRLTNLLDSLNGDSPFDKIRGVKKDLLPQLLKKHGIGCYNLKAKSMWELVNSNIDLNHCSIEDLEKITGIGRKTSRCFLIHSRPNIKCAGLDVHILNFLRSKGHKVPKSTPSGAKKYREIESIFLKYVKKSDKSVANFDLKIWARYARGKELKNESKG